MFKLKLSVYIKNFVLAFAGIFCFLCPVNAQEANRWFVYDSVKADIKIHENSEVTINEKLAYEFHGTFKGVFREITLSDDANRIKCQNNPQLQCGGFDKLEVLEVRDFNNNVIPQNNYIVEEVYNEAAGEKRLKITWIFAAEGRNFDGQVMDFGIKYKVYKSIGYFDDYDLFYWNAVFADRDVSVNQSEINVYFPKPLTFKEADLRILTGEYDKRLNGEFALPESHNFQYLDKENRLAINTGVLAPGQDLTILYKLPKGMVEQPPRIKVIEGGHQTELKFYENNKPLDYQEGYIELNSAGKYKISAKAFGYSSQDYDIEVSNGETKELNVSLKPALWGVVLFAGLVLVNCLSMLAIPGGIIYLYLRWKKQGRDAGKDQTIISRFEPPESMPSYMLGSIKDEKVDMVDISSTIIELAYKGYIKIIEKEGGLIFKSKYFEFKKLKEDEKLTAAEQKILASLFTQGDTTDTKELTNKFYKHISGIQDTIYKEMVEKNYFEKNPKDVRNNNMLIGVGFLVLGGILFFAVGIPAVIFHYLMSFVPIFGIAVGVLGIGYMCFANFMPAKTELGKDVLNKIYGFRMFIYHADRYRLQNLTPDMFERYLSYAVVFGLEKKWGEAFKDIYNGKPDWYESSSSGFNSILFANSLNNMMASTSTALASSPTSSGSSSGGGWSGGGGFSGGFSGGGGGGGGGGAL